MALQSTINTKQAFGVEGEFYDDSPRRVHTYLLKAAAGGALPHFGYAFTQDTDEGAAVLGGAGVFAGVLVNPKEHALYGVAGNTLGASLDVPAGKTGSLATMGHIIVRVTGAVAIGDQAQYNTTTGAISAPATAGTADSGCALIANSKFVFVAGQANGLAVLELGA